MAKDYVEQRDSGYFVAGTRVSLDSVVYAFLRGESPEGIVESYPALELEQVLGSLAFYLANRTTVDEYLGREREEFEHQRREVRRKDPAFYERLSEARLKAARPGQ